jgi:hypothetical protein
MQHGMFYYILIALGTLALLYASLRLLMFYTGS